MKNLPLDDLVHALKNTTTPENQQVIGEVTNRLYGMSDTIKHYSASRNPEALTLRDRFALQALRGLMGQENTQEGYFDCNMKRARCAYEIADAMLRARD